ncbi:hypothetical protein A2U01_0050582, partial [Trifolium medium]|nr:hypothetical protein [Trifolium medium]
HHGSLAVFRQPLDGHYCHQGPWPSAGGYINFTPAVEYTTPFHSPERKRSTTDEVNILISVFRNGASRNEG